jgi:hypothetical protein
MKYCFRASVLLVLLLIVGISLATAQSTCRLPQVAEFQALNDACQSVGINTTCVAQGEVVVTTASGERILRAGDRIANQDILLLDMTASPDLPMIYSRTMANLPATYANQSAVIIITGPAIVTDQDINNRFVAAPTVVTSTVTGATDVLSFPPDFGQRASLIVGSLAPGSTIEMDVQTSDSEYVRISYLHTFGGSGERASAWIASAGIADIDKVASLPVLEPNQFTPLQNLIVQPLAGCDSVQTLVQTPGSIQGEFSMNGLPYVLSSTVVFRIETDASGNLQLVIIPVMGSFTIYDPEFPDDPERALVLIPSTLIRLPVSVEILEDGTVKIEVQLTPESFDEIAESYAAALEDGSAYVSQSILDTLDGLNSISPGLLAYEIFPPVILIPSGIGSPIPVYGTEEPPAQAESN